MSRRRKPENQPNKENHSFCHLHNHTQYSQLDGYGNAEQYAKKAKDLGFQCIAITDHGNIDGAITFQEECEKVGIDPIIGCELYVVPQMHDKVPGEKKAHFTCLVKNLDGWHELLACLTKANLYGFYGKARLGFKDILSMNMDNFVFMSGCAGGVLSISGGYEFIEQLWDEGADLYLEIMPHILDVQDKVNTIAYEMHREIGIPLVATNDCHYIDRADWKTQEVLLAIQSNAKWNDADRWTFGCKGFHIRSELEMYKAFEKQDTFPYEVIQEAMKNTMKIAAECRDFRIPTQTISLPDIKDKIILPGGQKVEEKDGIFDVIDKICFHNFEQIFGSELDDEQNNEYFDRYEMEMDIYDRKGFGSYFIMVYEVIQWCRVNNIMVGPGRGSVGGSLVAYLMRIHELDPIEHNLSFSRFISEDRIDYPDIDIDFEHIYKADVRAHLEEIYGKNCICGVSTFMTMKSRAAVKDVARVFDIDPIQTNEFTKVIRLEWNIQDAIDNTPEGKRYQEDYPEIIALAMKLEGQIRGSGQHAAAVIISDRDLTLGQQCNLVRKKDNYVCNWNMADTEKMGLMKLDVLALNTLTVLAGCKRLMENSSKKFFYHNPSDSYFVDDESATILDDIDEVDFDFSLIPLDDKGVFKDVTDGNTAGTFQLSAKPSTELCMEMKIEAFEDIAHSVALVRPGPKDSGMTEQYIDRKFGADWEPIHPIYEEVTKNTYGILVFQEQVMQVISRVAGMTESEADKIRKIIAKKRDMKLFEQYKEKFLDGCDRMNTMSEWQAEDFWTGLEKWANYGFNYSHSVEYALLAYWTAWCKHHYPVEFICASLTYADKKEEMIKEAKRIGMKIMPPKIGISHPTEWKIQDEILYLPFVEIKGIGEKEAEQICRPKSKNKGFFADVPTAEVKDGKSYELLNSIGAFDKNSIPADIDTYFDYSITGDGPVDYADINILNKQFVEGDDKLSDCQDCDLAQNGMPLLPMTGKYNIVIIGETVTSYEDEHDSPLSGTGYDYLWDDLASRGYNRDDFHLTNSVKCPMQKKQKPKSKQCETCQKWLFDEIDYLECQLVLAIGNTSLSTLTGKKSGINSLSGEAEWVDRIGAWVVWCINPASLIYDDSNADMLYKAVDTFADILDKVLK